MNLENLGPGPAYNQEGFAISPVFWGRNTLGNLGIPITVYTWTDGTTTLSAGSRTQIYNLATGGSQTLSSSLQLQVSVGNSNTPLQASVAGTPTASGTITYNQGWVVQNAISFTVEGNLLIANLTYTVDGLTYTAPISIGIVTDVGGFQGFSGGFLSGKKIIQDQEGGTLDTLTPAAPATADPWGHPVHGFVDSSSPTPVFAEVLVGYFVTVATQGGVVVSVTVEPIYEYRCVGVKSRIDYYKTPSGGEIQR
jgi:hypothetical protein